MIEIKGLNLENDYLLGENISLTLTKSSIVGLIGPNGSGKSTFMRTLMGLRTEKTGNAVMRIDGKRADLETVKRNIFYFESVNWFNGALSGMDYLKFINQLWEADKTLIDSAIDLWNTSAYIHKPIRKYSLGMKQKILMSLYTVSNADYWFLDEPTLALDQKSLEQFKSYLLKEKENGRCIFFSTHENPDFLKICDRIYGMSELQLIPISKEWLH